MLVRYNKKKVRITTESGETVSGVAEIYPSGYGLHVFDRAEESAAIRGTHYFLSDIKKIEYLSDDAATEIPRDRFDSLIGELLETPCWIIDILPERVPSDAKGQYFAVERYYRQPERMASLYREFAELLIRLNCYYDMAVSFDSCGHWELNPDPEIFVDQVINIRRNDFLRVVFEEQGAMIDMDPGDTYLTLFDPEEKLLDLVKELARAAGLFVWKEN